MQEQPSKTKTVYSGIRGKILRTWDRFVYALACKSLKRITINNPGISYLIELHVHAWNDKLDITDSQKQLALDIFSKNK